MKTKIFYIVRGEAFRSKANFLDIVEIFQVFKHENPILAREKAFEFYRTYIDLFLLSKDKRYISQKETELELQDFFNSYENKKSEIFGQVVPRDSNMGIAVYYAMSDKPVHKTSCGTEYFEDEKIIHSISKKVEDFDMQEICFNNLVSELKIYYNNKYAVKNYLRRFDLTALYDNPHYKFILKTPVDFYDLAIYNYFRDTPFKNESK
jgi:hypothetical protein